MWITDIFIKRPVLASVCSLLIFLLGMFSLTQMTVRQYPFTMNAVVTVKTTLTGADPEVIAGFITTPLENSIAQADGIDYITSSSVQNTSTISIYLKLNYDPKKALSDIIAKINAVLNQLPSNTQPPSVTYAIGQTIESMYIAFYSDALATNQITDYLLRVVQPKLQGIDGIQWVKFLGPKYYAMRVWIDPAKLTGYGLTPSDVSSVLLNNNFTSNSGRTENNLFTRNVAANTYLKSVEDFKNIVIKADQGIIIRLRDIAHITLGASNYDTSASFNGKNAVFLGIQIAPEANLLTVINKIKKTYPTIERQLPEGLHTKIVYDATDYVNSSLHEVLYTLFISFIIVALVIFLFLNSIRSVVIPLIAIPLSLIGTFFIMLLLGYSLNLLTLLAFVLAIGLVVDDAIIIVENIQRYMENGMSRLDASLQGARELSKPILAISIVLIVVYIPFSFVGGLTGALFSEFAFTLAGTVAVSTIVALTLSPMMSSKILKPTNETNRGSFFNLFDNHFENLKYRYELYLHDMLKQPRVIIVFCVIILCGIYFLYDTSKSELAPQEDQGILISALKTAPNASLAQTEFYANKVASMFSQYPETRNTIVINGLSGLNTSSISMELIPWGQRKRTANTLQALLQPQLNKLPGAKVAIFQLPSLPGVSGLPIQFVIQTNNSFSELNRVVESFMNEALKSQYFLYLDSDLKIDKAQTNIEIDPNKTAEFGLTMKNIANILQSALSQNYVNFFDYMGRSYQVIPQMLPEDKQNAQQLLHYYINTASGDRVPLSTIAKINTRIVPESLNHFQQLNSATISAIAVPGVTIGDAMYVLDKIANKVLPDGYLVDYAGQLRQFQQESNSFLLMFSLALIIIFLALAILFESFIDPFIVLISVPMSIFGAMIFISLGIGHLSLNIYTEVGLVTLIGLISKHGILIVQFANDLQLEGKKKWEAIQLATSIRFRPILMTTCAMVLGAIPFVIGSGAGAVSRFNIGVVIISGLCVGTLFTLFVVPMMYMLLATDHHTE